MAEQAIDNTELHRENNQPTKRHFEWLDFPWQRVPMLLSNSSTSLYALCLVLCKTVWKYSRVWFSVKLMVWTWWIMFSLHKYVQSKVTKVNILPSCLIVNCTCFARLQWMLHTRLSISRFEFRMIPKACSDEEILVKTERWIFAWITLFRLDNLFSHVNDKEINSRHSKNYCKPILSTARDRRCNCKENSRG